LLKKYNGDLTKALVAYNWGMGNLKKWMKYGGRKLPDETEKYIERVVRYHKKYEKEVLV